jgi:hypothetical protein
MLNKANPATLIYGLMTIVLLTLSTHSWAGLLGDYSYDDCYKSLKSKYGDGVTEGYIEKICRKRYPIMPKLDDRGDVKFTCRATKDEKDIFHFAVIDNIAEMTKGAEDPHKIEFNVLVRKNNAFALKSRESQKINGKQIYIIVDVNTGTGKGKIYFADNEQTPIGTTELMCSE